MSVEPIDISLADAPKADAQTIAALDDAITGKEVELTLGVSAGVLYAWRQAGIGPVWRKPNKISQTGYIYSRKNCEAWARFIRAQKDGANASS